MSSNESRSSDPGAFEKQLETLQAGVAADLPAGETFTVLGTQYTPVTLAAAVGAFLALWQGARLAHSAATTAVQARDKALAQAVELVNAVHALLEARLGSGSEDLKEFGFNPKKKPAPLTGDERVAKAAKAKATREARGTLGSRQKAAVEGTPPGSVTVSTESGAKAPPSGGPPLKA
jgi:hypothetical protein